MDENVTNATCIIERLLLVKIMTYTCIPAYISVIPGLNLKIQKKNYRASTFVACTLGHYLYQLAAG